MNSLNLNQSAPLALIFKSLFRTFLPRLRCLLLVAGLSTFLHPSALSAGATPSFKSVEFPLNAFSYESYIRDGLLDKAGNRIVAWYNSRNAENGIVKLTPGGEIMWLNMSFPVTAGWGGPSIGKISFDGSGNIDVLGSIMSASAAEFFKNLGISTQGNGSWYVAKISSTGDFQSVRLFGGTEPSSYETKALAVDDQGSLYVAGTYTGKANHFGSLSLPAPPAGGVNLFLAKFSADGTAVWARLASGTARYPRIDQMALDKSGNVLVTGGSYESGYTLDGAESVDAGFFLTKFDPQGVPLWSRRVTNPSTMGRFAIAPDGSIYLVAGAYPNEALHKYSPNGDLIWKRTMDATANTKLYGWYPAAGLDGICYMTGVFGAPGGSVGKIAFGEWIVTTEAFTDMFLVRYSSEGEPQWAWHSVGLEPAWIGDYPARASIIDHFIGRIFSVNENGHISVSGGLKGTIQFGETVVDGPGGLELPLPFIATIIDPLAATLSPPMLRIAQTASSVQLSWPLDPPGYQLEEAAGLNVNWMTVSVTPTQVGSENVVNVEPTARATFYRLRKP